jgi:hypothetical protein
MFSPQSAPALPAPELSGFSAAPSVGSPSAFVGIEGAAKNYVYRIYPFWLVFCFFVTVTKMAKSAVFRVAVTSTTATNSHRW